MKKQFLLVLSLSIASINASAAALFDVPLAKECYAVYQRLIKIKEAQTNNECISELGNASYRTEYASMKISEDDYYSAKYDVEYAIKSLRHAQVYDCLDEEKIVAVEIDLEKIKARL